VKRAVKRSEGRLRVPLAAATVACVLALLAVGSSAYAFTDSYTCSVGGGSPCTEGAFHAITSNRVSTTVVHTRVCSGMETAAGNHRGGMNFCFDNTDSASECFSSDTPASQGFGFFLDTGGGGFDFVSGFVDNSPSHTGCIS
jgi:hypothetical protein